MIHEIAVTVAREAGALLREGFAGTRTINYKVAAEIVTDMDFASERLILERLRKEFPDHRVIAEEQGADEGARDARYCWIVDPLDGTHNYAHGYPIFCVSIALLERGRPVLGVVYDPMRDECFTAARGQGAFCNGRRIQVSSADTLRAALLSTGFPYHRFDHPPTNVPQVAHLLLQCQDIRRSGSAALDLCYVAAGRTDGYWELGIKAWDCAAGALLVEEAGGRLSTWDGGDWTPWHNRLLATNGLIHQALVDALGQVPHEQ